MTMNCNPATMQTSTIHQQTLYEYPIENRTRSMALLKPKYKRLVQQIYLKPKQKDAPVTLDSNRINTLTFYSSNYPEKVAKVANYFHKKIEKQVKKRKLEYVDVSLQALDILLASSAMHAYNLYAEHFLVVAATMLDTEDYEVQLLATRSMVKFGEIQEETPFYHGYYEPLIVKYSSMCKEGENRRKILGAKGLHAIVNKIALADLAENIWKPVSMDCIISGLLCCMAQFKVSPSRESICIEICGQEAEKCMSLLMSTASFGQVVSVLNSVYNYIDQSNLWGEALFVDYIYHLIMNSIQSRYWPTIVINGISRLQQQVNAPVSTRRNQLKVFCTMLALMKNQALGSLTFDYLNFLFTEVPTLDDAVVDSQELEYARDLMRCLESVSSCLAEYEMLEMMVFIVNKISETKPGAPVKDVMFRCLYTVTLKYHNRFPIVMYKPLLQLMQDPTTTVIGQTVFHTLLDIHGNLATINEPGYDLKVRSMPFFRPNELFIQNHDLEIYRVLLKTLSSDNLMPCHIRAVYRTLAVMGTFQDPNIVVRFLACLLVMQDMAVAERLSPENRVKLLVATLALLKATSETAGMPGLELYGKELVIHRQHAKWQDDPQVLLNGKQVPKCCLIDEKLMCERILDRSEEEFLLSGLLSEIKALKELLLSEAPLRDRETPSSSIDANSWSSARLFEDSCLTNEKSIAEDLSFKAMKAVLTEPIEETRNKMALKREKLRQKYQNCTFPDILNELCSPDEDKLREKVQDIINSETKLDPEQKPISVVIEERFSDLFY